jgi:hypothetical protein
MDINQNVDAHYNIAQQQTSLGDGQEASFDGNMGIGTLQPLVHRAGDELAERQVQVAGKARNKGGEGRNGGKQSESHFGELKPEHGAARRGGGGNTDRKLGSRARSNSAEAGVSSDEPSRSSCSRLRQCRVSSSAMAGVITLLQCVRDTQAKQQE